MELNSPRKNPYPEVSRAEDDLIEKGFKEKFSVKDDHYMNDTQEHTYSYTDVSIIELYRIADKENNSQSVMVIGLETSNGVKGILKAKYGKDADSTVDEFLRKADAKNSLNKKY